MLFVGYQSAVQYWRVVRAGLISEPSPSENVRIQKEDFLPRAVCSCMPDLPIDNQLMPHILVSDVNHVNRSSKVRHHVCSEELPPGSFCKHSFQTMVASPELCLLQAAKECGPKQTILLLELCCEFMGCYSLFDGNRRGFVTCEPLVTKKRMREYIGKLPKRTRGAKLLNRVVELSGERSWSPRETDCFLALSLPPELGGFGLPQPRMNPFDQKDDELEDDRYMVDLCWDDSKAVFEYDGKYDHDTVEKARKDKERRSALASQGYKVIVAVNESVNGEVPYRSKVRQVFGAIGAPMPNFSPKELDAQSALREALFDPSHYYKSPYLVPILPSKETA